MKRLLPFAWLMAAATAMAAEAPPGVTFLGNSDGVLSDYFRLSGPAARREPLHVVTEGPSTWIYVFGASNGPGRLGSFFRTDLVLEGSGTGDGSITFDIFVLPADADNSFAVGKRYSMSDDHWSYFPDIVGSSGLTGAATILVHVVPDSSSAVGDHSLLSAWGRTWTISPTGGSYSITIPGTSGPTVSPDGFASVPGAVNDNYKRTNAGCFNHASAAAVCTVTVTNKDFSTAGTFDLNVPPFSSVQRSLTGFTLSAPGGAVAFSTPSGSLTGYIVVNDNVTNDGDFYLASHRDTAACVDLAGTWTFSWSDRCGGSGTGPVVVAQSQCSFTAATPLGVISGTIYGDSAQVSITVGACAGSATGTATAFSSRGVAGTYSGQISGAGCCTPDLAGSFTLGR